MVEKDSHYSVDIADDGRLKETHVNKIALEILQDMEQILKDLPEEVQNGFTNACDALSRGAPLGEIKEIASREGKTERYSEIMDSHAKMFDRLRALYTEMMDEYEMTSARGKEAKDIMNEYKQLILELKTLFS